MSKPDKWDRNGTATAAFVRGIELANAEWDAELDPASHDFSYDAVLASQLVADLTLDEDEHEELCSIMIATASAEWERLAGRPCGLVLPGFGKVNLPGQSRAEGRP